MNEVLFLRIDYQIEYFLQLEQDLSKQKSIEDENYILKKMIKCLKNAELLCKQLDITKLLNVTV